MTPLSQNRRRHGATILEAAIALPIATGLVFFLFDLGLGVLRFHQVSQAARQGARFAIVHGELAPPELAEWGPNSISVVASANGIPIVDVLRHGALNELADPGLFSGLDLDQTNVAVDWLDGNTALGSRVRVTVSTPYQPIITLGSTYTLTGTSTMQIAH